jgi:hypothetical protein
MTVLDRCLALAVAAVVGCGGSEFTSAPPDVLPSVDAGDVDGAEEASPADARAEDVRADSPPLEACTPTTYFEDGDADGYGGTTSAVGCAPPTTGRWVAQGGDCDDSNATVHPGQTAYFAIGYTPSGTTRVSFDYDCDGQESESGAPPKAACAFVSLSCGGSGYLAVLPARSGAGVDTFCGSDEAVTCAVSDLDCKAGAPAAAPPIACH